MIFIATAKDPDDVIRGAMHHAKEMASWSTPHAGIRLCKSQWISWSPLGEGWIKVNMDGARRASIGLASARGLIRDHLGNWIKGFTVNIGQTDSFTTELWGLKEDLQLLDGRGWNKVIVELDSKAVIQIIKEGVVLNEVRVTLIHDSFKS